MSGERIALTKVTTKFVVNNLNKGDNYSLVQYSSGPFVVQPLIPMAEAEVSVLEAQITGLNAGGDTDLCGGLVQGIKIAVGSRSQNKVSAVLLLTDGHATTVRAPAAIIANARKAMGSKACSIFCFGFGSDHDAQLLKKIADDGAGSYYFIQNEADIDTSFGDCLGGLISVACQKMILTIEPLSGVTIKKVLGSKPPKSSGAKASKVTDISAPKKVCQVDDEDIDFFGGEQTISPPAPDALEEQQKLNETEEQKKLQIEEAAPGKDTPENLFLGDFYSEETRDVVFYVQLPPHMEPTPEFNIATVSLHYYNVISERYDKVSTTCSVKRSPEIPVIQTRDFALDLQINRLTAAAAMEEAQTKTDLNQAKQVVLSAITRLKNSISANDPFTQSLIADLQEILGDMKDKSSFQKVAVAKMAWKGDAHMKQRAVGSAGITYQTSAKYSMQEKAKVYSKEKK
jgi:hypothetical protein